MTDNEPKSWGDSMRAYDHSKKTLPWQAKEVTPVVKLGAFERRTLEREVDPILMQYRDSAKEQDFTQTLQASIESKKTKGQAGQPFNIINHEGPPKANHLLGMQNRNKREWNLLSHMPEKLHRKAPTNFNEDFQIECTKRKSVIHSMNVARGRDYSILSNKFNENDSARRLKEHIDVQDHLRKEYVRTRIYDPIKVQSYDEGKERQYLAQTKDDLIRTRQRQEERIPQSTKYAEGNTYNILTTEVTNADRLMQKPDRALNRYKGTATKIIAAKVAGDERAAVEDDRRMNRISYDRWEKTIDRGYDFVFGGPVGLNPLPRPQPSIWSRLHTDGPSSEANGGQAQGRSSFRAKDLSNMQPSGYDQGQLRASSSSPSPQMNSYRSEGNGNSNNSSQSHVTLPRSQSHSARESSRVPQLNLGACPLSPVSYRVPKNSLPGEPIAMVRTGGGLSSY